MIKSELVLHIASANPHLYQRDVENIVNAILGEITNAMAKGDRVELRGFGAFSVKHRPARTGRNPPGYLLTLRERQCQSRATPWRRTNPPVRCHLAINRRRRLAKRPPNRFERLPPLPAIPQLRFLGRSETSTISLPHRQTLHLFRLR